MTTIDSDPITTLFSETLVEFIRRNGPTATSEVACRFCWGMRDARKNLKKLEASGLVHSRLATTPLGTELEWRARLPDQKDASNNPTERID